MERYYPEDDVPDGTLVVNAHLDDRSEIQTITLTTSTSLLSPDYQPKTGCVVRVEREDGDVLLFEEGRQGTYRAAPGSGFMVHGSRYRLVIADPQGNEYCSDYEALHPPLPIDSVYFRRETRYSVTGEGREGIRFYTDFTVDKTAGEYVRWEMTETYEFHNPDHKAYIYDLDREIKPLHDSLTWRTCWITNQLPTIYTLNLAMLREGIFREKQLNFVSREPQRLHHRYSLLVKQYTLTPAAYGYWNKLKENTQSQGNLFDKQPAILYSNICNRDDPGEKVIGFFSVSGMSEHRIFVEDIPGLELPDNEMFCFPLPEIPPHLNYLPPSDLPLYFTRAGHDGVITFGLTEKHCIDCREYEGSTHIMPDFWTTGKDLQKHPAP